MVDLRREECRCERPAAFRPETAGPWHCPVCGGVVPEAWLPSPAAFALLEGLRPRVEALTNYDAIVGELGEPDSVMDPAQIQALVQKYGVGAEVTRQAHWRFGDLVSLMVQEHPGGSVTLRFGFLESLPRNTDAPL